MPRSIDFTKENLSEWGEARLPEDVYGEREITSEEFAAHVVAFDGPVSGFSPQFSTYGMPDATDRATTFDVAHAWLSGYSTGPWHWTEHWTNHGHHLDVAVYVERKSDRQRFASAFPEIFKEVPEEDVDVARLAVARGVLPKLTSAESFSIWCREKMGFAFLPSDDLGEKGLRVTFGHAGLEEEFVARFGDRFAVEDVHGRRSYAGVEKGHWRDGASAWLSGNAVVGNVRGGPDKDGVYRYKVDVRYPDVAEAMARDWGHVFSAESDGTTFSGVTYPTTPEREIPADFLAYLEGTADEYDAPHLPEELKPFARQAASPAPRP